jgi:hypothetical protein
MPYLRWKRLINVWPEPQLLKMSPDQAVSAMKYAFSQTGANMTSIQSSFDFIVSGPATVPPEVAVLIERGALFVVNHSGGKDSQAMYLQLREIVPADQLVLVHADLVRAEWAGAVAHIQATTSGRRCTFAARGATCLKWWRSAACSHRPSNASAPVTSSAGR